MGANLSFYTLLGFVFGGLFAMLVKFAALPIADGLHRLHLPFGLAQALATEPAVQIAFGAGFGGLLAVLIGIAVPAILTSRSLGAMHNALPVSGDMTKAQFNEVVNIKGFMGEALQKYTAQTRQQSGKLVSGRSAANYLGRTGLGFGLFRLLPKLIFMLGLLICIYTMTQAVDKQLHAASDANVMMLGYRAAGSALFFAGLAACLCWLAMQLIEAKLAGQLIELGLSIDSRIPVMADINTKSDDHTNDMSTHFNSIKDNISLYLQDVSQTHHQASVRLMDATTALSAEIKSFGVASANLVDVANMNHKTVDKFLIVAERMGELHKQISMIATQPAPSSANVMPPNKPSPEMPLANSETVNRLSSAIKNLRDAAATETLPKL